MFCYPLQWYLLSDIENDTVEELSEYTGYRLMNKGTISKLRNCGL